MMDEETNSETTRPAGREDVVRAHAAEEEWLVQYFIKRDRTPEASIVSPRLLTYSMFLHSLKLRYIYLRFVSTARRRLGDETFVWGGLRRGAKHFEIL